MARIGPKRPWRPPLTVAGVPLKRPYPPPPPPPDDKRGVKHDAEKPRWDLLPLGATSEIVDVLTYGARKYAPDNWRKVPNPQQRYYAAAMRHIVAWVMGERLDPESGKPHLAHAACCLLFLLEFDGGSDASAD